MCRKTAEDTINSEPLSDELPEMPSLDEVSTMAESIDNAAANQAEDEVPVEDTAENFNCRSCRRNCCRARASRRNIF